jgi:hypothetical protein
MEDWERTSEECPRCNMQQDIECSADTPGESQYDGKKFKTKPASPCEDNHGGIH